MLLSFKEKVFEDIISGEKIYEHRKVFPNEPIKAYLYVSTPVCSIQGVLYLGKRIKIEDWIELYGDDIETRRRINDYLTRQKYAMEILEYHETNSVPLKDLRRDLERFVVPQMYYFLDGTELKKYLDKNLIETGKVIRHNFKNITEKDICRC